ncbi:MAG: tRNA epoxyqueuosine(34) reductase QueG [Candidatus Marinimicrobia bacterium]|jgi:epoxyqueuosine reductase|nr:tRNA epoxyqueuosine(34) reductase QueG [Candidatus Neomarinimicrobiota bacterium]|tara:strand:+ start:201 stop:1127 length:927 start_codon:yes stop_codon:yes gene_type:complete
MNFSEAIKNKALELGFQKVGIAKAEAFSNHKENLEKWIASGRHASMDWIVNRKEERGNIHNYFPEAKSVISVGMNYYTGLNQSNLNSKLKFSNYAWGEDYHAVLKSKLYQFLDWIKKNQPKIKGIACVDTSPVMEKVFAQKAGLGWQGKHTSLITRDYGSWLFLGELIVDIPLDYDSPFIEDLCGSCTACIDECPTNALDEYKIDSNKCISYRSIEHRGPFKVNESELQDWIYGCDICQEVCPWNQKFSVDTSEKAFYPRKEIIEWEDDDWAALDEEGFRKLFKKSSVKRTKYSGLNRNIKENLEKEI